MSMSMMYAGAPTVVHSAAPTYAAAPTVSYAAAPMLSHTPAVTTTYAAAPTTATYAAAPTVVHGGSVSYAAPTTTATYAAAPTTTYAAAPTATVAYAAAPTATYAAAPAYHIPQTYVKPGKLHPVDAAQYKALQQAIPWQRERLAERQHMFARMDALNHNGILSFSEVEAGLNSLIGLERVVPDSKMVLMKCFNEAKDWCQSHTGTGCPYQDYVEKKEFRMMLELLHKELDMRSGPDTGPHE